MNNCQVLFIICIPKLLLFLSRSHVPYLPNVIPYWFLKGNVLSMKWIGQRTRLILTSHTGISAHICSLAIALCRWD